MFLKWLVTCKILVFPRKYIGVIIAYVHKINHETMIIFKNTEQEEKIFSLITQIRKETQFLQGDLAAYFIYLMASKTYRINGDIAEVGVYKGATAKLICEARKDIPIHLFDTFEGLPELGGKDDPILFKKGDLVASIDDVSNYLNKYTNVHLYKGLFPKTTEPIKNSNFSFVHLDVDIYESTLDCLKFFYPRLSKGAILISHDYVVSSGVYNAFNEFFKDKPEIVFELPSGEQCMVIKL